MAQYIPIALYKSHENWDGLWKTEINEILIVKLQNSLPFQILNFESKHCLTTGFIKTVSVSNNPGKLEKPKTVKLKLVNPNSKYANYAYSSFGLLMFSRAQMRDPVWCNYGTLFKINFSTCPDLNPPLNMLTALKLSGW